MLAADVVIVDDDSGARAFLPAGTTLGIEGDTPLAAGAVIAIHFDPTFDGTVGPISGVDLHDAVRLAATVDGEPAQLFFMTGEDLMADPPGTTGLWWPCADIITAAVPRLEVPLP